MKTHFVPALKLTLVTMVLFGVVYPLLITTLAQFAENGGAGALVLSNGKVVGFEVIGQSFTSDKYFNGRPSAVGYNAASTGGSNKGPTNPEYLAQVEERIQEIQKANPGLDRKDIPVELVTASGGGLDPHISPAAAEVQVLRIAKARGLEEAAIRQLIKDNTQGPLMGLFGTSTVNVLSINLALDKIKQP